MIAKSNFSESGVLKRNYYFNLDTIRCVAAFMVVGFHWIPSKMGAFPFAKLGVDIFFVLSGFLISEILFKNNQETGDNRSLKRHAIKVFYIKRSLRIFPIYYLLVCLFFILNQPPIGGNWIYLFSYTTNFLLYHKKEWIYPLSHLWSLSVEEQFYIIWPFFIFFIKRKWHLYLILLTLIFSLVFIIFDSPRNYFFFVLPFSCMSSLATGALLAYLKTQREHLFYRFAPYSLPVLFLTGLVLIFSSRFSFIVQHIVIAIMAFALITYAVTCRNRTVNKIFSNPVTSYLGKISYGIYLYHNTIPWLVRSLNGTETATVRNFPVLLPAFKNGYAILVENLLFLLIVSSVSWFLIERPVNKLKARFSKKEATAFSYASP